MKTLIMSVSLVGSVLFGAVCAVTFVSPSVIDYSAREFVIYQIDKEIARHQVAGVSLGKTQEKLVWLKDKYATEVTALKGGLRIKITDILNKICNVGCLQKKGINIFDVTDEKVEEKTHEKIAKLTDVSAKLEEMIKGRYYKIISELLSDIRIFSGLNAFLFLFIALILISKLHLIKALVLPTGLLFVATVISTGFYILGQNWFYAIIFHSYVGYGYLGYVGIIFMFLVDIALNRGDLTFSVLRAVGEFVEAFLKAVASCCPSV